MSEKQPPVIPIPTDPDEESSGSTMAAEAGAAAAPAKSESAEDRKAASALAALDSNSMAQQPDEAAAAGRAANFDVAAVRDAMARLEGKPLAGTAAAAAAAGGAPTTPAAAAAAAASRAPPVKSAKVDQADVTLLAAELELSKTRATELLRVHDGDAVRAMRAYVGGGVGLTAG